MTPQTRFIEAMQKLFNNEGRHDCGQPHPINLVKIQALQDALDAFADESPDEKLGRATLFRKVMRS